MSKELELLVIDEQVVKPEELATFLPSETVNSKPVMSCLPTSSPEEDLPLPLLAAITMTGAGIQFGWALQLSLLTPYVEVLGIPHAWASFIWLCGPVTGMLVQPFVGAWSDTCQLKMGRRRPFILFGAIMVIMAVLLISFSADIGYILGDKYYEGKTTKPYACALFVFGFWWLDLSNNAIQVPSRALLSDLASIAQLEQANALYSFWLAVGNVLGYSAGSIGEWYRWFPWLTGPACPEPCANLKAAFLLAILFLSLCVSFTLYFAKEVPLASRVVAALHSEALLQTEPANHTESREEPSNSPDPSPATRREGSESRDRRQSASVVRSLLSGLRKLSSDMKRVLLVMALTWLAWFPFLLFDTDWMGREVFRGDPNPASPRAGAYQAGVRAGSLGLLLNSVVLGLTSLAMDPLCCLLGPRIVWSISNFILSVCLACTYVITRVASSETGPPVWLSALAVSLFAALGVPLAVTFSVPYALTADLTAKSGGGHGIAMGILNLAIVVPQMVVSLVAGPWDQLFGGGNVPAFLSSAFFALCGSLCAAMFLPAKLAKPGMDSFAGLLGRPH